MQQVTAKRMKVENYKGPPGEEETLSLANREVTKIKQKLTYLVKDGRQFPALQEIVNLQSLPDPNRVFQDLARAQARVKVDEVSKLTADLEAACANLAALVMTLGEGLNSEDDIKTVVAEIEETEEIYVKKAREALRALAEASGKEQTAAPTPLPPAPRPESNKFSKISATA